MGKKAVNKSNGTSTSHNPSRSSHTIPLKKNDSRTLPPQLDKIKNEVLSFQSQIAENPPKGSTFKLFFIISFYLGSNMILGIAPLLCYIAYDPEQYITKYWNIYGFIPGFGYLLVIGVRIFCFLAVLDYFIPIPLPGPSLKWCKFSDDTAAKLHYFPSKVVWEGSNNDFNPNRNYLAALHPHGLFGISYNLFLREMWRRHGAFTLFTGADVVMYLPVVRRCLQLWGYSSCAKKEMVKNLNLKYPFNVLTLLPGGIGEMFYGTKNSEEQIILRKRYGMFKLALETGSCLIPLYGMGSNQVFDRYFTQNSILAKISSVMQTSILIWTDRFGIPFGLVPKKEKIVLVVGKPIDPIEVMKGKLLSGDNGLSPTVGWLDGLTEGEDGRKYFKNPSQEQVIALQDYYVKELKEMFKRNRHLKGKDWEEKELWLEDEKPEKKKKE